MPRVVPAPDVRKPDADTPVAMMTVGQLIDRMDSHWEARAPIVDAGPRLESFPEFGQRIGRSETWVRHAVDCGLPVVMLGAHPAIDPVEAIAWLRVHGSKCVMPNKRGGR